MCMNSLKRQRIRSENVVGRPDEYSTWYLHSTSLEHQSFRFDTEQIGEARLYEGRVFGHFELNTC
jgi:hypothetical protein